ncbi:hypothetical protein [Halorhabdus salina]|uniref:hypothetical protein n=1 Tax=Halorhabdus salina TaxID=2750670 RepID=UPI0015EECC21|nr:hypothetical protein [Halorhabdus salina]
MTERTTALVVAVIAIVGVLIATPAISAHGTDGETVNQTMANATDDRTMMSGHGHGHHAAGNASEWMSTNASDWPGVHANASDWLHGDNDTVGGASHADDWDHAPHDDDHDRDPHHDDHTHDDDRGHGIGGHGC